MSGDPQNTPSWVEIINDYVDAELADRHFSLPATVVEYNAAQARASVQPVIRRPAVDDSGARVFRKLPQIHDVPVVWPGAGGFRVVCPVAVGDTVLLVFSESSIATWRERGGSDIDPGDPRRNALSDAVAVPGLRSFNDAFGAPPADTMALGRPDGPDIQIDASEIRVGGAAGLALVAELNALRALLAAHVHPVTAGQPFTGPSPTIPTVNYPGTQIAKGS